MSLLLAEDVSFAWSPGNWAIRGLSLALRASERVCLLGTNGAGKSTALLLLNGAYRPCAGTLTLDGIPYGYSRSELLNLHRRVALILQNPDEQVLAPSVVEDVALGALASGRDGGEARACAMAALESMGIAHLAGELVDELSYGQKKRVAIAGALVSDPDVLLLDEPTSGLDAAAGERMLEAFDALAERGKCVLLTTHDSDLAWSWADRILILHEGRLIADAPPDRIAAERWRDAGLREPMLPAIWSRIGRLTEGLPCPRTRAELLETLARMPAMEEVR